MNSILLLAVGIWIIALASIALHEVLSSTSDDYKTAVKWVSGISIVLGIIIGAVGIQESMTQDKNAGD